MTQNPAKAASENEPLVLRAQTGAVATLTLNRPRQANALSEALLAELQGVLDAIAADSSVRVVVLAGAGKAFSAGHDLKEMRACADPAYHEWLFSTCSRMMMAIARMGQPVIARVHGIATAAGCQLVAACDLAVAGESARFGTNGIDAGLFCTTPGVAVGRTVARKHALDLLLTGGFIDARRAEAIGLVSRTVADGELDATVRALAETIAAKSGAAIAQGKRAFHRQIEMPLEDAYRFASRAMAEGMALEDAGEGIDSFIAKRPPSWKHR